MTGFSKHCVISLRKNLCCLQLCALMGTEAGIFSARFGSNQLDFIQTRKAAEDYFLRCPSKMPASVVCVRKPPATDMRHKSQSSRNASSVSRHLFQMDHRESCLESVDTVSILCVFFKKKTVRVENKGRKAYIIHCSNSVKIIANRRKNKCYARKTKRLRKLQSV